ncbi:MAG: protease modulator HflC [Zavarzinella sp.]
MRKRRGILIFVAVVLVIWLQSSLYTVDHREFCYVTRFGDPIITHNGEVAAGLHWKLPWPIDSIQRIDRRLHSFELPATETLTRDLDGQRVDKTISVDAFVVWKIPNEEALDRFVKTVGSPEQARRLLIPRITGRVAAVISQMPLEKLIEVVPEAQAKAKYEQLHQQILGTNSPTGEVSLPTSLREEYGIEIVDLRIRRLAFPEAVRSSIAERIRSERQRKVAEYQSEGNREYTRIVAAADRDAALTIANAKAKKQEMEGKADAQADAIRSAAYARDPEFFAFLQKLATYRVMLSETRDVLLLSTKNPIFDMLFRPPTKPERDVPRIPPDAP